MVSKYVSKEISNWLLLMLQVTLLFYLMLKLPVKMVVHVEKDLLTEDPTEDLVLLMMLLLLLKSTCLVI